ncbi:condensation domain-containing protein [Frankia sp. AiPs1]|uniref:condensation domain-containing protein n=1 Tax=Frankia sp. AiPs1 TaxID=573493 RepID=UPI0020443D8F|nr:condensation domain-containing protein [Frankia sp. AiPs1]MCM3920863.1 condensation domain-containing protein [Frankia sp. AiPs1]
MAEIRCAPFEGARSRKARLTWGQQEILDFVERARPQDYRYNIIGTLLVPPEWELTEERCLRALSFFLSRHESLRTVFPTDRAGQVWQEVQSRGSLPVRIVRTARSRVAEQAGALRDDFATRCFAFAHELPVQVALIVVGGRVHGIVHMFCHLAVDLHGVGCLVDEMTDYFRRGETLPSLAQDALTPVDLADWQVSPAGAVRRDRTLRHVESLFRDRQPLALPPETDDLPGLPRFRRLRLHSKGTEAAAGQIARKLGVSSSAVLLGGIALHLRELTGSNNVDLLLVSSQRFRQNVRNLVATLMQEAFFAVDLTGVDLPEAIRRSWRSALIAYQNSGCDAASMKRLLAGLGTTARTPLALSYCVNDRRRNTTDVGPVRPDYVDSESLLHDSLSTWPEAFDLVIDGDGEHLEFVLTYATRYFHAAEMEKFLPGLEAALSQLADAYTRDRAPAAQR